MTSSVVWRPPGRTLPSTSSARHSAEHYELENVATNDVLPLKAARRYAIANAKWFLGPRDMPTTLFRLFHLHSLCGATLFGSHQHDLRPSVWHSLVGFRLLTSVCNAWQRSRTQNLQRVIENSGPILARLWTKVHEILERCRRPLLQRLCPIVYVTFRLEDICH